MIGRHSNAVVAIVGVAMPGIACGGHPPPAAPDKCVCERARIANGWCGMCSIGYVAGLPIPSSMLYEEIDPHGHPVDPDRIECRSCQAALSKDGFCDACHIGFVRGRAYFSKLTYRLAQGHLFAPRARRCTVCRTSDAHHDWCEKCQTGRIGSFSFSNRETYEEAVKALRIIEAAVRKLPECAVCAAAIVGNGYCPKCRIRYRDGKPVQQRSGRQIDQPDSRRPPQADADGD